MARFDVLRPFGRPAQYAVDVQSDVLSDLDTRAVIPLEPVSPGAGPEIERLMPVLNIDGQDFLLVTTDIAMVPSRLLGPAVTNVEAEHSDTITTAIDFLFQGY